MSIKITSGCSLTASATASAPVPASPTAVRSGALSTQQPQAAAQQRLIVGDQDPVMPGTAR